LALVLAICTPRAPYRTHSALAKRLLQHVRAEPQPFEARVERHREKSAAVRGLLRRQQRREFRFERWRFPSQLLQPRLPILVRELEGPVEQRLQHPPAILIKDGHSRIRER